MDHASDNFRMFCYKVQPCFRVGWHDWHGCSYLHSGERARKRDPRLYYYISNPCLFFKRGFCPRGDMCWLAHGQYEAGLHPSYYRTERCRYGANCTRRVCFFAHTDEELRHVGRP